MRTTILICTILLLALTACAPQNAPQIAATPYPAVVSWDVAVEIIHSGQVETAAQLHNLQVTLYLKDGQVIETTEPSIDAIFQEVEKCGQPCSDMMLATE